ncbi:MAG: glucosaminidase domain-containing protein [Rhodospirillales bacterium]
MNFERGSLGLVVVSVAVLLGAVVLDPPSSATSSPKVSLEIPVYEVAGGPAMAPIIKVFKAPLAALVAPHTGSRVAPGTERQRVIAALLADPTTTKLSRVFAGIGYKLDSVLSEGVRVPRLFLASLPADMVEIRESKFRKALFFQTVLPLILQVNEEILADRRRIWRIRFHSKLGERTDAADRLWLSVQAERYGVKPGDLDALLRRVDIIPPSMALAQAAEESGWGTSRFVREGNAVFGQWTFSETASLTPLRRDEGKTHKIKGFASLVDSVRAYVLNLNTHRAYRGLRKARAGLRSKGAPLDGEALAGKLTSYSERGKKYVAVIRSIISANGLRQLDDARLSIADSVI